MSPTHRLVPLWIALGCAGAAPSVRAAVVADESPVGTDSIGVLPGAVTLGDEQERIIGLGRAHRVRAQRGYLGLELLDLTSELRAHFGAPQEAGVMVARVEAGSPAAKAGIAVGDVIVQVAGRRMEDADDLREEIRRRRAGESVDVELVRGKARRTVKAAIEEKAVSEVELGGLLRLQGLPLVEGAADEDEIRRAVERALRGLRSAPVREQLERYRGQEDDIERRTRELEERLRKLEQNLGNAGRANPPRKS